MSVYDPMTRQIAVGELRAFQSLLANAAAVNVSSLRLSIAFSKMGTFGSATLLDQIDTGAVTFRGQGDRGFQCDSRINLNNEMRGVLAALTFRARSDAAVFMRDADIIATGTIQFVVGGFGSNSQFLNVSVVVKQVNNVVTFTYLETQV
jgi:hypothetical protein